MRRQLTILLLLLATITTWGAKRDIHILAVNDIHATIDVFPQLAALVDSLRTEDPGLLVFSAGDNRTGNPLSDKYRIPGYPIVALMNMVGFNASGLGNHEFDNHSLAPLTGLSSFRYLCANAFPDDSTGVRLVPCQVFDVEGLKVGVVSAIQITPQGIPSTHPDNVRGIAFKPAEEVVPHYEWLSRQCDATILLSHLGYQDDVAMADRCPWLDLIIGGHTHTQLSGDEMHNGVLITQNKNKFNRVTYITLTVENGHVTDRKAEYIDVKKFGNKNMAVAALVNYVNSNPTFKRVVGQAKTPFDNREEVACMVCDAFMDGTDAEIAVENPGGIRVDGHAQGDITLMDVLEMDPFDNHAVVLELTGDELLHMMLTYSRYRMVSFPYVSGMLCELTLNPRNPELIKSVKLLTPDGKKMNMKRKYRVATNNYIPATSIIPEGSAHVLNVQTTDLITQFLEKQGTVSYQGVKRLLIKPSK